MYKKLNIDFEIPELLSDGIDGMIHDLNENEGRLADCYQEDIRNTLNGCDTCLDDEQIELLRNYYCRGGIYESD